MPLTLTQAGAGALAQEFGTAPLPAGEDLFIAAGRFTLLPALTTPGPQPQQ